jgi:hypothetical protein
MASGSAFNPGTWKRAAAGVAVTIGVATAAAGAGWWSPGPFGPTNTPVSDTANLWIDSNGGTCTRNSSPATYVDAAACATINAAQAAASADDTIKTQAGTYAMQTVSSTNSATSGHPITVQAATGATVQFGPSTTLATSTVTFFQSGAGAAVNFDVADSAAAALWVTAGNQIFTVGSVAVYCTGGISGTTFQTCFAQAGSGCDVAGAATNCTATTGSPIFEQGITVTAAGSSNLTFKNLTVPTTTVSKTSSGAIDGITFDNITSDLFYVTGNVTNYVLKNSSITLGSINAKPTITSSGGFDPNGVTVQDTAIKHITRNESASPAVHNECLQTTGGANILLDRVKMDDCAATADLAIANDLGPSSGVTVRNSWFGLTGTAATGIALSNAVTTVTLEYNTLLKGITLSNPCSSCGNVVRGNYGTSINTCTANVTFDDNLMKTGSCTGDRAATGVDPAVVATADPFNLHIASCSGGAVDKGDTGSYPVLDIDGTIRYLGAAPEAGSDECG